MYYDLFLAGPWERFSPIPYKDKIRAAFPGKKIFDPEERVSQANGDWFADNFNGIVKSSTMVSMVPEFPFPGVGPEAGMFYFNFANQFELKPLDRLVIIWPRIVIPQHGMKVARHLGKVVETTEEAIEHLRPLLE